MDLLAHTACTRTLPASSIGSSGACGLNSCLRVLCLLETTKSVVDRKIYTKTHVRKQFAFDLPLNSRRIHQSTSVLSIIAIAECISRVAFVVLRASQFLLNNFMVDVKLEETLKLVVLYTDEFTSFVVQH